jgi:transposase InsO family protein
MTITAPDQVWVANITYIRPEREFVYLAVILDACSRRVVGWYLDNTLQDSLMVAALRMAIAARGAAPVLVHHSDRGVQYASGDYTLCLKDNDVAISMSRKSNPSG